MQLPSSCIEGVADVINLYRRGRKRRLFSFEQIDLDNVDSRLLLRVVREEIVTSRLYRVLALANVNGARGNTKVPRLWVETGARFDLDENEIGRASCRERV